MNRKQKVVLAALPTLALTMIPTYRLLARWLGQKRAWYAGFVVYWSIWCIPFSLWAIGPRKLKELLKFKRLYKAEWFMLIIFPTLAFLGRYTLPKAPRSAREKTLLIFVTIMNSFWEEVLWRGVYITLFPDNPWWAAVWPTLWFAVWHYAPGSISPLADARTLMIGAGVLGASLSWLSLKTQSIRSAAVAHILGGLAQALS
ncbi:MAG TPA: CPBP family intramembrane glutamic endopeptidase [Anaerolineae bacterium]|nr:CPBP family intramembrane glutamic endopeptidase [Anaerolineae bacterium]